MVYIHSNQKVGFSSFLIVLIPWGVANISEVPLLCIFPLYGCVVCVIQGSFVFAVRHLAYEHVDVFRLSPSLLRMVLCIPYKKQVFDCPILWAYRGFLNFSSSEVLFAYGLRICAHKNKANFCCPFGTTISMGGER